jgi:Bacterial Ig-like domain
VIARGSGRRRLLGWVGLLLLGAACARVRPLEGGPPDIDPPRVLHVEPADSTTGLSRLPRFEIDWSERLASTPARTGVRIMPYVRTEMSLHGTRMIISATESLPPDTTVVLVLTKTIQDRPGRDNKLPAEIPLVYSTGPELRAAAVFGKLRVKGQVDARAVIQWEPVHPDTDAAGRVKAVRGPLAAADAEGLFRLVGIPPNVPFLLRGFLDRDGNLYADEGELVNTYPDTLRLGPGAALRGIDWNLIDPNEPGQIRGVAINRTRITGPLAVAVHEIARHAPPESSQARAGSSIVRPESVVARADTVRPLSLPVTPLDSVAWAGSYRALEPRGFVRGEWVVVYVSPRGDYSVRIPPGRHALIAFVDVRRDSVPGLYVRADSTALDWEPLVGPDTLQVGPGGTVRAPTLEIRER